MHPAWQTFLKVHGVDPLEAPRSDPTHGYCSILPHVAILALEGRDASDFLQGYLTADTRALEPNRAVFGGYCDIKGRVVADLLVVKSDDGLLLATHESLVDPVRESLAKYLAFSRSKLVDARHQWLAFGLLGRDLDRTAPTDGPWSVRWKNGCACIAVPGPTGWVCLAPPDRAEEVWSTFPHARGGSGPWLERDVAAGLAHLEARTSAQFLPQMLGYEALGAISFSKGCYLGQEVVTRAQHRGQVKRQLGRWTWRDAASPPTAGTVLLDENGARCGTVIQAVARPQNGGELLAVAARDRLQAPLRFDHTPVAPAAFFSSTDRER